MISCRKRIKLEHYYYNVFPVDVSPLSATTINEAIFYSVFVLNNNIGSTQSDITEKMNTLFPQYSTDEVCTVLKKLLKTGALITLTPITRGWCVGGYSCGLGGLRAVGITFNPFMDQNVSNNDLVTFLIQLSGGTRSYSLTFNQMFIPYSKITIY